jgi:hypothetical protein
MSESIAAFKGFDSNLKCRGYQYEIGGTYTHDGNVEVCSSGFHACEYPLDVFSYYSPAGSRYALVEQSGELSRRGDDSKVAASHISIGAEIDLPGLIQAAIEYTFARAKPVNTESNESCGAASSTGDRGAASSTGDRGAASSTGYRGAASSTGDRGAASSTGDRGAASSTGDCGAASSTGDCGAASSTGDRGAASSTGYRGAASSTGDCGAASSTGKHSVAMACGFGGKAMAGETGAIVLVNRNNNGEIVHIRASKVGDNGIKPGVWYQLNSDGEFVEVGT